MKYDVVAVAVADGDDDLASDGDEKEGTKMRGKIVVVVVAPLLLSS